MIIFHFDLLLQDFILISNSVKIVWQTCSCAYNNNTSGNSASIYWTSSFTSNCYNVQTTSFSSTSGGNLVTGCSSKSKTGATIFTDVSASSSGSGTVNIYVIAIGY